MSQSQLPVRKHLFLRPWWQLTWIVLLMSASELLTRYGAAHAPQDTVFARWDLAAVGSVWTWVGTLVAIAAFGAWLHVLRNVPLSLAFNISQGTYLVIPLGAAVFLHEKLSPLLLLGIALVLAGVLLLVPDMVKAESEGEIKAEPKPGERETP